MGITLYRSDYYSGNVGIGAQHYANLRFNYSHDVDKKLTIGGAAKILFGMAAFSRTE